MYLYYYIYKSLTIDASHDCNLDHFIYLEKVDKLTINSDCHLYYEYIVIQSKVVYIDSPTSVYSNIIDSSMNYSSSKFTFTHW